MNSNKRLYVLENINTREVIISSFDKKEVNDKYDELKNSVPMLYGYYDRV